MIKRKEACSQKTCVTCFAHTSMTDDNARLTLALFQKNPSKTQNVQLNYLHIASLWETAIPVHVFQAKEGNTNKLI